MQAISQPVPSTTENYMTTDSKAQLPLQNISHNIGLPNEVFPEANNISVDTEWKKLLYFILP